MFYEKFLDLCGKKGVSKQKACLDAGLSSTAWIRWKDGATPSSVSLRKICDYFGVTTDSMVDDDKVPTVVDDGIEARQEILDRLEMKALFDAARNVPASKLYDVVALLNRWKEENGVE